MSHGQNTFIWDPHNTLQQQQHYSIDYFVKMNHNQKVLVRNVHYNFLSLDCFFCLINTPNPKYIMFFFNHKRQRKVVNRQNRKPGTRLCLTFRFEIINQLSKRAIKHFPQIVMMVGTVLILRPAVRWLNLSLISETGVKQCKRGKVFFGKLK